MIKNITELLDGFNKELVRQKYHHTRRLSFAAMAKRIGQYVENNGSGQYNVDLGLAFLREHYPFPMEGLITELPSATRTALRTVTLLNDFHLNGIITKRTKSKGDGLTPAFRSLAAQFRQDTLSRGYSEKTAWRLSTDISTFLRYLIGKNVVLEEISESEILGYMESIAHLSKDGIQSKLYSLKKFLSFLHKAQLHAADLSDCIPAVKRTSHARIPSVWSAEDVKKILAAVDRGSPLGKRDYAVLLLATRLGIRSSDVVGLKIEHLKWDDCRIEFTQSKTNQAISLPLFPDVGWAIIDYLKHGRPPTDLPNVFFACNAPIRPMPTSMNAIVSKYSRLAGVSQIERRKCGLHSLRHTLASRLLEAETPLPVISEILGHTSPQEVETYLKVDIERLRLCALNPEEVFACVNNG